MVMKKRLVLLVLMFVFVIGSLGCSVFRKKDAAPPTSSAPPGRLVAIARFKCNCDPLVSESIQDSFLDIFFKGTNAKLVKGEKGDIVIVGVITMESSQTTDKVFSPTTPESTSDANKLATSSASGAYVTGITAQAYKSGELIATQAVGQNRGEEKYIISPVNLATQAANNLLEILTGQNEIGKR
jgi:hypothetical protein